MEERGSIRIEGFTLGQLGYIQDNEESLALKQRIFSQDNELLRQVAQANLSGIQQTIDDSKQRHLDFLKNAITQYGGKLFQIYANTLPEDYPNKTQLTNWEFRFNNFCRRLEALKPDILRNFKDKGTGHGAYAFGLDAGNYGQPKPIIFTILGLRTYTGDDFTKDLVKDFERFFDQQLRDKLEDSFGRELDWTGKYQDKIYPERLEIFSCSNVLFPFSFVRLNYPNYENDCQE